MEKYVDVRGIETYVHAHFACVQCGCVREIQECQSIEKKISCSQCGKMYTLSVEFDWDWDARVSVSYGD